MQSMFTNLHKSPPPTAWPSRQTPTNFFDAHPVGDILGSLVMSSLLWIVLAFALYSVYTFLVA